LTFICIGIVTLILTYYAQIKAGDKWNNFLVYVFSGSTYFCAYILIDIEADVFDIVYSIFSIFFIFSTLFITLLIKPDKSR